MPEPKAPQDRLQPALLDRLTDDQPETKHEPIEARPDTLAYRTAKLIRRHRAAFALAALAFVASIAGIVGTSIQARTARVQRDFALRQLARAEAINDLNSYVLSDAAPSGKPFTVNDLLARAEDMIRRQHRSDESSRVDLLISIGRQYTVQDEYTKARSLLEEAYRLSRGLSDVSTRATASCGLAQALSRAGDAPRAEKLFQEGLSALPGEPRYALDRIFCLERGSEVATNGGDARDAVVRAQAARGLAIRRERREAEIGPVMREVGGCQKDGARLPESCQARGGIVPDRVAH